MTSQPTIQQYILSCYLHDRPELCNGLYYARLWGIKPHLDEKTMRATFLIIHSDLPQMQKDSLVSQMLRYEGVNWKQQMRFDHLIEVIHSYQHDYPANLWDADDPSACMMKWLQSHEETIHKAVNQVLGGELEVLVPMVFSLSRHMESINRDEDDFIFCFYTGHELILQDERTMAEVFCLRFLFAIADLTTDKEKTNLPQLPGILSELGERRVFTLEEKEIFHSLDECFKLDLSENLMEMVLTNIETITWDHLFKLALLISYGLDTEDTLNSMEWD